MDIKDSMKKINKSSTYGLVRKEKIYAINLLKCINYEIISINTDKLTEEESKEVLSYVYDLILTLDKLVGKLENIKYTNNE